MNSTLSSVVPLQGPTVLSIFLFTITILTGIFGVVSNAFVLNVMRNKTESPTNALVFLENQVTSDLLHSVCVLFEIIICSEVFYNLWFPSKLCEINNSIKLCTYYLSAYFIAVLACERFMKIFFSRSICGNPFTLSVVLWTVIQPLGYIRSKGRITIYFTQHGLFYCVKSFKSYGNFSTLVSKLLKVLFNFIPMVTTGLFYILILYKLKYGFGKPKSNVLRSSYQEKEYNKRMSNTTQLCLAITIGYYAFYLPNLVLSFFVHHQKSMCRADGSDDKSLQVIFVLTDFAQIVNPILLIVFREDFQVQLKNTGHQICRVIRGKKVLDSVPESSNHQVVATSDSSNVHLQTSV